MESEGGPGLGPGLVGVEAELDGAADVLADAGDGFFVETRVSTPYLELDCAKTLLGSFDSEVLCFSGRRLADDCVDLDGLGDAAQELCQRLAFGLGKAVKGGSFEGEGEGWGRYCRQWCGSKGSIQQGRGDGLKGCGDEPQRRVAADQGGRGFPYANESIVSLKPYDEAVTGVDVRSGRTEGYLERDAYGLPFDGTD